jgi:hypothetical protein
MSSEKIKTPVVWSVVADENGAAIVQNKRVQARAVARDDNERREPEARVVAPLQYLVDCANFGYMLATRQLPGEVGCSCADIMMGDETRHFRGCPMREKYPTHEAEKVVEEVNLDVARERNALLARVQAYKTALLKIVGLSDEDPSAYEIACAALSPQTPEDKAEGEEWLKPLKVTAPMTAAERADRRELITPLELKAHMAGTHERLKALENQKFHLRIDALDTRLKALEKASQEFQPWHIGESPVGLLKRIEALEKEVEDIPIRRGPMTASELRKVLGHDGFPKESRRCLHVERVGNLLDPRQCIRQDGHAGPHYPSPEREPLPPTPCGVSMEVPQELWAGTDKTVLTCVKPTGHDRSHEDANGTLFGEPNLVAKFNARTLIMPPNRKIVCLCGSTRFAKEFGDANLAETLAGNIVLTVGSMTHSDDELSHCAVCGKVGTRVQLMGETCQRNELTKSYNPHRIERSLTPEVKEALDALHKDKISMADEVFVLNVVHCAKCHGYRGDAKVRGADGCEHDMKPYIGDSTKSEIAHAIRLKKRIRFLNPHPPSGVSVLYENDTSGNTVEESMYLIGLGPKPERVLRDGEGGVRRDATPVGCDTCINKCMDMDMDPYCVAVNKPYGSVLTRPRPKECAGESGKEYKLWEKDTRGHRGGG